MNHFLLTSLCLIGLALPAVAADHTTESLASIKRNVDNGTAVLVDVRSQREWDSGHIADALFLPVTSLEDGVTAAELRSLPKDKILYIHCVVGKRALTAANILEKHGYQVRPVKPGYKELISAGFPQAQE